MSHYTLWFDGGENPTDGTYGSYEIETCAGHSHKETWIPFESGTNNEAEYQALIAGLQNLVKRVEGAGADPKRFTLKVHGDSRLILKQVYGTWRVKAEHLRSYRDRARELSSRFNLVIAERVPRDEMVWRFGH